MATKDIEFQHPEIETLEREDIVALQQRKLKAMGERLTGNSEWREHLAKGGLRPADLADPQSLDAVPLLEKADLHALYPFPMLGEPMERVARFFATSGTTGLPVMFGFTQRDLDDLMAQQIARMLRAAGFQPGDRVYQGHGYGLWIGGPAMDLGLKALGATNFPIGPGRADMAVRWMRDQDYTACIMSPLWMMSLIDAAERQGIDPRADWKLRVGGFDGQSVSLGFRDEMEAALPDGFMAQNIYGTTEAGGPVLGISCPYSHDHDLMHLINDDTVMTELLDPENLKPVGPGEIGEIVITTLDKQASPVLRWRTRDLARLAENPFDCPCGRRGLPLISRLIGRSDDMLKVRSVIVYPSQIEDVIAAEDGTVKHAWQIYIDQHPHELEELVVACERRADAELPAEQLAKTIGREIRARVGIRVTVDCHEEGSLPRYEGKAQRVLVREAGD